MERHAALRWINSGAAIPVFDLVETASIEQPEIKVAPEHYKKKRRY